MSRCAATNPKAKSKNTKAAHFLSAVIDDAGVCRGICAMDLRTMEVKTFAADAVIFCTGGIGAIFGRSTNSVVCTGSAQSALFQQGVDYANGEFIQVHPTAIPGEDKLRLMSESARGEGGRVWVPKKAGDQRARRKPFPKTSDFIFWKSGIRNTAISFRAISPRAPFTASCIRKNSACTDKPRCISTSAHIPRETLDRKLEGILEIYEKFLGVDPREEPMKVFPAMHYTMGGMWVNARGPGHQRSGNLRRRRMRISISRRESPRREFAGLLHFRRRTCRASGGEVRDAIWKRARKRVDVQRVRSRTASGRKK